MFTIWGFLQLLARYPGRVPDVDIMFDCMDKPIINRPSTNRCLCRFSGTARTVITLISHFLIGPSRVVYDYCTGQSLTFIPGKSSSEKSSGVLNLLSSVFKKKKSGVLRKEVGKRRSLLHIGKETQMLVPPFVQSYLTATTRRCGVRRLCVRIGKRKQELVMSSPNSLSSVIISTKSMQKAMLGRSA
ncbi:uncharacterized protein LOC126589018 [Malus sylvestris]|uniref:uncharacterized protein LOC126589018 n=1 Tax=Malus sylvestris TaxID=3752 RepID=UPI0021ACA90F|nr:uncharacterized protein LOC126589018 [Malus sylvestris]